MVGTDSAVVNGGDTPAQIADVLEGRERWAVVCADSLALLKTLPDQCVDAVVTDPPAGIKFMQKSWDDDKGGRRQWIAWLAEIMTECRRVMKPGAHGLVWALPRTSHWTGTACEDAGFEVRDRIGHVQGAGFPKSLDMVGAAIAEGRPYPNQDPEAYARIEWMQENRSGYGTALKPAVEDWWLIRAPFKGTVAANVCEHGTGAINVDGCRVATDPEDAAAMDRCNSIESGRWRARNPVANWSGEKSDQCRALDTTAGRFPPNLLLSHSPNCVRVGTGEAQRNVSIGKSPSGKDKGWSLGWDSNSTTGSIESVPVYNCAPGCPVAELNRQSGNRPGMSGGGNHREDYGGGMFGSIDCEHTARCDSGGAARFFPCFDWDEDDWFPFRYVPKPSRAEREAGCEDLPLRTAGEVTGGRKEGSAALDCPRTGAGRTNGARNNHPTVKSIALMRWLCRLVTPPNGIILDPFAGSGTTLVAANLEGFRAIGIELDPRHVEICEARIRYHVGGRYHEPVRRAEPEPAAPPERRQLALFGGGK